MKELTVSSKLRVYENFEELPLVDQHLMSKAIEVRKNAYAPYSRFKVGVAIQLNNGEIVLGSNQENAAYPSGLCAERVAIFHAGSIYPEAVIEKIAITATSELNPTNVPVPPCGGCRQSIYEYESRQNSPIEILFMGETGEIYRSSSLKNLLPYSFEKNLL